MKYVIQYDDGYYEMDGNGNGTVLAEAKRYDGILEAVKDAHELINCRVIEDPNFDSENNIEIEIEHIEFESTCCEFSLHQLNHYCSQHGYGSKCPDVVLSYFPGIKDLPLLKSGFRLHSTNSCYEADYCPACGKNLKVNCIPKK